MPDLQPLPTERMGICCSVAGGLQNRQESGDDLGEESGDGREALA